MRWTCWNNSISELVFSLIFADWHTEVDCTLLSSVRLHIYSVAIRRKHLIQKKSCKKSVTCICRVDNSGSTSEAAAHHMWYIQLYTKRREIRSIKIVWFNYVMTTITKIEREELPLLQQHWEQRVNHEKIGSHYCCRLLSVCACALPLSSSLFWFFFLFTLDDVMNIEYVTKTRGHLASSRMTYSPGLHAVTLSIRSTT